MPIKVEMFSSPGCGKCTQAKAVLRQICLDLGDGVQWREVNVLDEIDYAVSLGVLSTPALAIDGILAFARLPSARTLREYLHARVTAGATP